MIASNHSTKMVPVCLYSFSAADHVDHFPPELRGIYKGVRALVVTGGLQLAADGFLIMIISRIIRMIAAIV